MTHLPRTCLPAIAPPLLLLCACNYDPPPEPSLPIPVAGVWEVGDPLEITFTEPIAADSLAVRVWPADPESLTPENEIAPGVDPVLDTCRAGTACTNATLAIASDRLSATLAFEGDRFTRVKVPWQLEVLPGLQDDSGAETAVSYFFDFQFAPSSDTTSDPGVDIEFQNGHYVMLAVFNDPVPATLILIGEMRVLPDGRLRWVAASAKALPGYPKNNSNPDELFVRCTEVDKAFAVFVTGSVQMDGDERFMRSDPFEVHLQLGSVGLSLLGLKLTGAILPNPETGDDRIEGTVSYAKIVMDIGTGSPFEYGAGNTDISLEYVSAEKQLEGSPDLCNTLCGCLVSQCDPPVGFPGEDFCPTE